MHDYLWAAIAGLGAGTINAVVGSGSLISFPILLALGLPALDANITSNIGLLAGNASSIGGYRRFMGEAAPLLRRLLPASFVGGLVGSLLLLLLPTSAFDAVVPVLVAIALVLVVIGPWVNARVARGNDWSAPAPVLVAAGTAVSVYGGYFGAAQGVLLIAVLGLLTSYPLQMLNATKIISVLLVNLVSAVVFMAQGWSHIHWRVAAAVAVGSVIGGVVGAHIGSRLPPWLLRATIVVIGAIALVVLLRR